MHNKSLSYRPDIDGLRALAVLAVVIFHFNKDWLPGGFVGVDIFFVISGFLITGIIARQHAAGTFSFGEFYMRRVRRILPAAFFVTLCTLVFGLAFMLPDDAKALSSSAIATTLSAANIYFWKFLDTSYFAASSDTVPLLHMWSLGVEEQFYLIWPALLLLTLKFGGRMLAVGAASVLAAASFWYGEHMLISDPTFAYYMLPSRGGELLIGGLAFFACDAIKGRASRLASEAIGLVGIALLAWSLAFIRETEGFPGFISLIPSLGAAMVIASGSIGKTAVGSALSIRPMVAIGLVSFSLYLWHWPVLAFYRYAYGNPVGIGYAYCAAAMALLTIFSYFFIEKQFRTPSVNGAKIRTVAIVACAACLVSISWYAINNKGLIKALSPDGYYAKVLEHYHQTKAAYRYDYNCQTPKFSKDLISADKCILGPKDAKPTVLVFGDSNSAHYVGYVKQIAEENNITVRNISHDSCIPLSGEKSREYVKERSRDSCVLFNKMIRDNIANYDTLFVSADWPGYRYHGKNFFSDIADLIDELSKTNKQIVIGLKVPIFKDYDRRCDAKAIKIPFMQCGPRGAYSDSGETEVNNKIIEISSKYENVSTFSVRDYICKGGECSAYLNSKPVYFDLGHISMAGSEQIGQLSLRDKSYPEQLAPKK